jgi:hypothetical protein
MDSKPGFVSISPTTPHEGVAGEKVSDILQEEEVPLIDWSS